MAVVLVNYCKNPKIQTLEKIVVFTLKFEEGGSTIE